MFARRAFFLFGPDILPDLLPSVKARPSVKSAPFHCFFHIVVSAQNALFRAESAETVLVFFPDDGELVEDMGHCSSGIWEMAFQVGKLIGRFVFGPDPIAACIGREIEMKERGIEFATEFETPILVPVERRAVVTAVFGEG